MVLIPLSLPYQTLITHSVKSTDMKKVQKFYRIDEWVNATKSRVYFEETSEAAAKYTNHLSFTVNAGDYYPHVTIQTFEATECNMDGWNAMQGEPFTVGCWI